LFLAELLEFGVVFNQYQIIAFAPGLLVCFILVFHHLITLFVFFCIVGWLVKVKLGNILEFSSISVRVLLVGKIVVHSPVYHFCALKSKQRFDCQKRIFSLGRHKLACNRTKNFTKHIVDSF
jgi:hypothetical protein